MSFSPNGEYFAFCSPDGNLKLWETASNTLRQEYASTSHLSATCCCLRWRPQRTITESLGSKRKKRKSEIPLNQQVDLLALGTSSGSVLLYSVLKGDLQAQWTGSHEESVNDVAWCTNTDILYSCSTDQHIIEWCSLTGTVKQRWKGDKGPVYAVCLCNGDSMLLSAGRVIKLWDLATKKMLQKFGGHATEVFSLVNVPTGGENGLYFLSAAADDRLVHVWHCKSTSGPKAANESTLASLQLTDVPVTLAVSQQPAEDGSYLFSVVTASGHMLVFQQILNGRCKKPLKPKVTLQFASSNRDIPKQLCILSAELLPSRDILLAYGDLLNPRFEKLSYNELQPQTCLVRDDPSLALSQTTEVTKVKTPLTSNDVKVLAPGHMAPTKPTSEGKKARRQRLTSTDLSVEDRLHVMGIADKTQEQTLQTTSSAILLAQGLQSNDSKILNHVLQNSNLPLIRNTVRKLPVPLIIPLVDELSRRMHGHAQGNQTTVKWIKTVLTVHSSYLMTFPELVEKLSTLYQLMDSRVTMFGRLSKLQGKLELLLSQVSNQGEVEESAADIEPLLTLQDEDSDDEMLMPGADDKSDDNWEDESDVDAGDEEMEVNEENGESSEDGEELSEDEKIGENEDSDCEVIE